MSENLQKLIGVAAMAVLVVVGVVVSSGDDTDFTRNLAFGSGGTGKGSSENDLSGAGVPFETGGTAEEQLAELLDRSLKLISAADIQKATPAYIDRWDTLGKDDNERHYYDQEFGYHFICEDSFLLWMEPRNGNGDSDVSRSSIGTDAFGEDPRFQNFFTHRHDPSSGRDIGRQQWSAVGNSQYGPNIWPAQRIPKTTVRGEPGSRYVLVSGVPGGRAIDAIFTIAQWKDENGRPYPMEERENVLLYVRGSRRLDANICNFEATFVRSYP